MYIRQQCVFSFEDALKMQPQSRLERIMVTLDFVPLLKSITVKHRGPTGYDVGAKLRALVAARIEQIPNTAALVRRLQNDPHFRYTCGFEVFGAVPSEATFSRLIAELSKSDALESFFNSLVKKAEDMGIIGGSVIAIDSTKLEAYEKSKPKRKISQDGNSADWGVKRDTDGNKIKWFGYKVHLGADTKSELPVAFSVTPASVHDGQATNQIMDKTRRNLTIPTKYWVMDAAYDSYDIYLAAKEVYHPQAIIPLNTRGAKEPKDGFDFDGTPICSAHHRMVYWGCDNKVNKFRCPHVLGKVDCPFGSAWCSDSNYGLVIKTRPRDDLRLFSVPHRNTAIWENLYKQRTAVERCNSRLKKHLNLEALTVRGKSKVETHVCLSLISLVATVIAMNVTTQAEEAA